MSHFTVLVIGANHEAQLAPFHEFECTGEDDQYIQNVDETPELLEDYNTGTRKMVKIPEGVIVVTSDPNAQFIHPSLGTLVSPYDNIFYQDHPTEVGFDKKPKRVRVLPEGYEEVEVPKREMMSWRDYVLDHLGDEPFVIKETALATIEKPYPEDMKWGFVIENDDGEIVKVIRRTNPNKQWDWYQVGGRWSGMLKLKPGAVGKVGQVSWAGRPPESGYVDQATIGDIDFAGMRADAEAKAAVDYDRKRALIEKALSRIDMSVPGTAYVPWADMLKRYLPDGEDGKVVPALSGGADAARVAYHDQPFMQALKFAKDEVIREGKASGSGRDDFAWVHWFQHDDYLIPRDQFIREAGLRAGLTYAIVKDSTWYQRGEMGWFGISSGEVSEQEWLEQFAKLVDDLPEDTMLTVVDCHI